MRTTACIYTKLSCFVFFNFQLLCGKSISVVLARLMQLFFLYTYIWSSYLLCFFLKLSWFVLSLWWSPTLGSLWFWTLQLLWSHLTLIHLVIVNRVLFLPLPFSSYQIRGNKKNVQIAPTEKKLLFSQRESPTSRRLGLGFSVSRALFDSSVIFKGEERIQALIKLQCMKFSLIKRYSERGMLDGDQWSSCPRVCLFCSFIKCSTR